jgi:3alpha(or 20beta)-hydroxysteroid dehydrogenase
VLDILVNNAGVSMMGSLISDLDEVRYQKVIDVNQIGTWLGMGMAHELLKQSGGGSIVNIGSICGMQTTHPGIGAYVASKWAIRGLTRSAALEMARDGIRVNCVHPGGVESGFTRAMAGRLRNEVRYQPISRSGKCCEVADVVLFLASDRASFITGSEVTVDGGRTVGSISPVVQ